MSLTSRFEHDELWTQAELANPYWHQKARLIRSLLPEDVKTILDVGCGDGTLTKVLTSDYVTFGIDGSYTALSKVTFPAARAWVDRLPIRDCAVDLVLCSEVLEHLPTPVLRRAICELQRVTRAWILITVPYREQLQYQQMKCNSCHKTFHVYGHVQRFDLRRLRRFFKGWRLVSWAHVGESGEPRPPTWLLLVRQYFGNRWYFDEFSYTVCPYCQNTDFKPYVGNRLAYWCEILYDSFSFILPRRPPYWLLTLWKREE